MIAQHRELINLFSDNIKFKNMYIFLKKSSPFSTGDFIVFFRFFYPYYFFNDFVPASFQKQLNRFTSIFQIWQVLIWTLLIFFVDDVTSFRKISWIYLFFYRGILSGEHLFTIQDVMLNFRAGRQKPRGLKLILSRKRRRFPELLYYNKKLSCFSWFSLNISFLKKNFC